MSTMNWVDALSADDLPSHPAIACPAYRHPDSLAGG
jgi:hypothetical protein